MADGIPAEVRLYEPLFTQANPEEGVACHKECYIFNSVLRTPDGRERLFLQKRHQHAGNVFALVPVGEAVQAGAVVGLPQHVAPLVDQVGA